MKLRAISRFSGFSLVEIMVAMVVGVVTIVVIMQSYAAFEGQKRTTSSGSDTQENGLIALQAIESDARTAGYGLLTPNGLLCTSMNYYETGITAAGTFATASIAPVIVTNGAAGASDTIIFTAATSTFAGMPFVLDSDVLNPSQLQYYPAQVTEDQDLVLIASPIVSPGLGAAPMPCSRLAPASAVASATRIYNTTSATFFPTGGYAKNTGFMIDIGSGLNAGSGMSAAGFMRTQYSVNANNDLVATNVSHMVAQSSVVLSSNIVSMQVQYGVAPTNTTPGANSPSVNCWTDASATGLCNSESGDWSAPSAADIMRIKSIRIAVVARSSLQERPASGVGSACDATVAMPITWTGAPAIDLSLNNTATDTWQCHRYRVYQTIIPLRNVIWAKI